MTKEEYIRSLMPLYHLVGVLRKKDDSKILRLRNKQTERDMVLRSFPRHLDAYETLCTIRCVNLPEIFECLDLDDGQIVLEEFIDGVTVAQVLETGKYRHRGAKKVLSGVCNALAALHDRGFVHRDVKPDNVMVDSDGRVVLIDFDASRRRNENSRDTVVMGTVGYAAPEQLGLSQSDARTDIYAVGVLYNVMLTGKHPSECFASGRAGRVIKKCTALNPNDRYQTVHKLLQAL